jgi:hypothetical protein
MVAKYRFGFTAPFRPRSSNVRCASDRDRIAALPPPSQEGRKARISIAGSGAEGFRSNVPASCRVLASGPGNADPEEEPMSEIDMKSNLGRRQVLVGVLAAGSLVTTQSAVRDVPSA